MPVETGDDHAVDTFYTYQGGPMIEGKRIVAELFIQKKPVEGVQADLRTKVRYKSKILACLVLTTACTDYSLAIGGF